MNKENNFYVYLHKDLNGNIFYVGKGRNNRYKDKSNRGKTWKQQADHGYTSEFYAENLDENSALQLETKLIKELEGLVNSNPASKLIFTQEEYSEYFEVNSDSDSGLIRTNAVWTGNHLKGKLGNIGYISERNGKKYWRVKFKNKSIMIHRVIWILVNGDIPDNQVIDHIDGNGLNNKIENLRLISKNLNCKNKTISKNNKLGVTGVYLESGRYRAIVTISGNNKQSKSFSIATYGEQEAFRLACEWRKEQIRLLNEQGAGYTERHGT
jgi:hypothetical protein